MKRSNKVGQKILEGFAVWCAPIQELLNFGFGDVFKQLSGYPITNVEMLC